MSYSETVTITADPEVVTPAPTLRLSTSTTSLDRVGQPAENLAREAGDLKDAPFDHSASNNTNREALKEESKMEVDSVETEEEKESLKKLSEWKLSPPTATQSQKEQPANTQDQEQAPQHGHSQTGEFIPQQQQSHSILQESTQHIQQQPQRNREELSNIPRPSVQQQQRQAHIGSGAKFIDPGKSNEIEVFIRKLNGQTQVIRISPTAFVKELRTKVTEMTGIAGSEFRMEFSGKPLEDAFRLQYYGIHHHCTINMNGRLRGGRG